MASQNPSPGTNVLYVNEATQVPEQKLTLHASGSQSSDSDTTQATNPTDQKRATSPASTNDDAAAGSDDTVAKHTSTVEKDWPYWDPKEYEFEDLERYRPGGYCPVRLWQTYKDGRYLIVYKIAHGGFSTVWLAKDREANRYVALKFLTADVFETTTEAEMLKTVGESNHPGKQYVVRLLDSFVHVSPNGLHHVLAMPVVRPLMRRPVAAAQFPRLTKQLVEGLDCIHSCGMVHADLHTSNIGYSWADFSDDDFDNLDRPLHMHALNPLGGQRPPYLLGHQDWMDDYHIDEEYKGPLVAQIMDFGSSFFQAKNEKRNGVCVEVPDAYMPPEHFFDKVLARLPDGHSRNMGDLNIKTDIWALGASIFELRVRSNLLGWGWKELKYLCYDTHLPERWERKWQDECAKQDPEKWWSEALPFGMEGAECIEKRELLKNFMLSMIALDPQRRLDTKRLLQHQYLMAQDQTA